MKKSFRAAPRAKGRSVRRGSSVLTWTLASSSVVVPAAAQVSKAAPPAVRGQSQDAAALQFNIPAGPLETGLTEFRRLTGLGLVLGDPGIGRVQSPGAVGSMTPEKAMESMLTGTGLHATFSTGSVRLDVQRVREVVAVTGDAPKVESPKYTEPLRDTPQTLVVIPQEVYHDQNAATLRDVLRNTPGITMSIGEGGSGGTSSGDNILIRGFSARTDIYVDGIHDPGMVNRDAFDVEAVEVAKGPSSVTTGRGSTGGSINLVTKTPEWQNFGTIRFTGGNGDSKRTTVDANQRISDSAAFRLNGMWQNSGYPGRDVAKYRSWGVSPSLALGLGKATKLTLAYTRYQQDNIPDWGIPTLLPDTAIAQGITVNNLNFSNFYGIASRDYEITKTDRATVTLNRRFGETVTLRNTVRYGKNYRDAVLTPPRPATTTTGQGPEDPGYNPLVPQIRRTDTKYQHRDDSILANQTDVAASFKTGFIQNDLDVGLELSRDHQPTYAFTDLFSYGRPPVDDLFNPTPNVSYTPAFARTGASSDAHAITVAAYAFDTVKFSDHWQVNLGGRWDHVKADYTSVAVTGVATPFGRTDADFSGRAGLVYKPTAETSIYAAISTSFTPSFDGTLGLTLAATGVNSQTLAPEKTRNLEIGTKFDLARHLDLTASLFSIEKTNAKTTDLNGATVLAGDQSVKGGEVGLSGNLTSRWNVFGGLALMKGKVKSSDVTYEVGQELAYVPHVSLNLWTTYRLRRSITIAGGINYSDGNYFNNTGGFLYVSGTKSDPRYVQNAAAIQALTKYWLCNAGIIYTMNKHLTIQVNGLNLNNAKYADRAYDRHFLPGPTRQVLAGPVINW